MSLNYKILHHFYFCQIVFQVTLIARGDVPLSIVMTVCTTLGAVLLTPFLTKILAGTYIPVDAAKLSVSTLQVASNYNKPPIVYYCPYGLYSFLSRLLLLQFC